MKKISYKDNKDIKGVITPLYLSAFPASERPPLRYFYLRLEAHKENDLYAYYDNDEFIGFSYLTIYKDICYIFFLAVSPEKRNKGYGSKILSDIKENNKDKVIMLCYEEVDKKYKDYDSRLKRKEFYKRNGFKDNKLKTNEYGVVFETGYIGNHKVSFDEYKELFKLGFGDQSVKHLKKEK